MARNDRDGLEKIHQIIQETYDNLKGLYKQHHFEEFRAMRQRKREFDDRIRQWSAKSFDFLRLQAENEALKAELQNLKSLSPLGAAADNTKLDVSKPSVGYTECFVNEPEAGLLCDRPTTSSSLEAGHSPEDVKPPISVRENSAAPTKSPEYADALASVIRHMNRPRPEMMTFDGNPLDYGKFITNFDTHIISDMDTDTEKLSYLLQCCKGPAKRLIEICYHTAVIDPKQSYLDARKRLHEHYGKDYIIASACVESLIKGSNIKPYDSEGLLQFATQLRACFITVERMHYFGDLNTFQTLISIAKRLPFKLREKWARKASEIESNESRVALFKDFVVFVEAESTLSNSRFRKALNESTYDSNKRTPPVRQRVATHTVVVNRSVEQGHSSKPKLPGMKCPCCEGQHQLSKCYRFRGFPRSGRRLFLRDHRLCDNCFQAGHFARECTVESKCTVEGCKERHDTLLHPTQTTTTSAHSGANADESRAGSSKSSAPRDGSQQISNVSSSKPTSGNNKLTASSDATFCTPSDKNDRSVYLCIVPVRVQSEDKVITTYAFLDQGSTVTLCDERLLKLLKVKGQPTEFNLTTISHRSQRRSGVEISLIILSLDERSSFDLPSVLSVKDLPVKPNTIPAKGVLEKFSHLEGLQFPKIQKKDVLLLIGADVPEIFNVLETRIGKPRQPIAVKFPLGWTLMGPSAERAAQHDTSPTFHVNFTKIDNDALHKQVERLWQTDFADSSCDTGIATSREDRYALKLLEESVRFNGANYELPLLWKPHAPPLRNNRAVAVRRLVSLEKRLKADDHLRESYVKTVNTYIEKGYAQELSDENEGEDGKVWYLPHHAVMHPRKPDKVRVVFDCSAKYCGLSLNDVLLQGPCLANDLVATLLRFRQEQIVLVGDIESMFHRIRVRKEDCNALRFLWWPDGDLEKTPTAHQMLVHLFGATSSPVCANYCLRRVADDFGSEFDFKVTETVKKNFYVDDYLCSVSTEEDAITLVNSVCKLLAKGGFRLTKFVSNSSKVMETIPESERAKTVAKLDLSGGVEQRVLGVNWNVIEDKIGFKIDLPKRPCTRRGILSVTCSLYDPLGLAAPVTIVPKLFMQDLCKRKFDWDQAIPQQDEFLWNKWLSELPDLETMDLTRCVKPSDFGTVKLFELHHFCDASSVAWGAVSYLRMVNAEQRIHCAFMIGKSRLAPLKTLSIPRLELTAAVLAVKLDKMLRKQLEFEEMQSTFWTDSTAVLQIIRNSTKRFPVFVANRVAKIEEASSVSSWRHVASKQNPADDASRGISAHDLCKEGSRWLHGPAFLWKDEETWPELPLLPPLPDEFVLSKNPQRVVCVGIAEERDDVLQKLISDCSYFFRARKKLASLKRCIIIWRSKTCKSQDQPVFAFGSGPTLSELKDAEMRLIQYVQRQSFGNLIDKLSEPSGPQPVKKYDCERSMLKLNPILVDGVLRVGGRLSEAEVAFEVKHPIILPNSHHLTDLIIQRFHHEVGHAGLNHTWASLRNRYWIIRGGAAVRRVLGKCLVCRRWRAPVQQQVMADLPRARLQAHKPAFSETGVDYFGPIFVKQGRNKLKRWGCLFTCLSIRAIHLEVVHSLDTSSFIDALRRFLARRGNIEHLMSDNGSNFVGAKRELNEAVRNWNQKQIVAYLHQRSIKWSFNPPTASHMGGSWERMIRSTRRILTVLLAEQRVTDETLLTVFAEAEGIINSRPITPITLDPENKEPLTPSHLLLLRPCQTLPPDEYDQRDAIRCRWKQAQYLADQFWLRWTAEYMTMLNSRQKWLDEKRNLQVDDVVLVVDTSIPRSKWLKGVVVDTFPDKKGHVRATLIKTVHGLMKRPISKLCLILENN